MTCKAPGNCAGVQEGGLEGLLHLIQEPRRLWRRYLVMGSKKV